MSTTCKSLFPPSNLLVQPDLVLYRCILYTDIVQVHAQPITEQKCDILEHRLGLGFGED